MMKKIYLSVDWISRSISVSTKKDWVERKLYCKNFRNLYNTLYGK